MYYKIWTPVFTTVTKNGIVGDSVSQSGRHDCLSITELTIMEDLQFSKRGRVREDIEGRNLRPRMGFLFKEMRREKVRDPRNPQVSDDLALDHALKERAEQPFH